MRMLGRYNNLVSSVTRRESSSSKHNFPSGFLYSYSFIPFYTFYNPDNTHSKNDNAVDGLNKPYTRNETKIDAKSSMFNNKYSNVYTRMNRWWARQIVVSAIKAYDERRYTPDQNEGSDQNRNNIYRKYYKKTLQTNFNLQAKPLLKWSVVIILRSFSSMGLSEDITQKTLV